jgi:hypothetical protein
MLYVRLCILPYQDLYIGTNVYDTGVYIVASESILQACLVYTLKVCVYAFTYRWYANVE